MKKFAVVAFAFLVARVAAKFGAQRIEALP